MVGWDKVTNPTCTGGLGLFQVKARNDAILAKLCWCIASNPDEAWSQMLCRKYLTPARLSGRGRKYLASRTWKACKVGGVIFNKGLKWAISNGEGVNVWNDFWLLSGLLRCQIQGPLAEGEENCTVKDFLSDERSFSFVLPELIVLREITVFCL